MANGDAIEEIIEELAPPLLTESQVLEMIRATAIFKGVTIDPELLSYLTGSINQAALKASPALYERLRGSLTGAASPEAIAAARNAAAREAATWVSDMARAEMNKLGSVIAEGVEQGWGFAKTAKRLELVQGLDKNRAATLNKYMDYLDSIDPPLSKAAWEQRYNSRFKKLLSDRRKTIATTETRYAVEQGHQLEAIFEGKRWHSWLTVGDNRVSDQDQAAEAQGWIPIDKAFANGVLVPPSHPNCRCTVAYRTDPPDAAAQRRVDARAAKTEAAKEAGEEQAI